LTVIVRFSNQFCLVVFFFFFFLPSSLHLLRAGLHSIIRDGNGDGSICYKEFKSWIRSSRSSSAAGSVEAEEWASLKVLDDVRTKLRGSVSMNREGDVAAAVESTTSNQRSMVKKSSAFSNKVGPCASLFSY
jgi:hypothetical protein